MRSKVLIAGAIIAVAILCVTASVAYSLAPQGQAVSQDKHGHKTCTVQAYVIDPYGNALPGIEVTLHVLGHSHPNGDARELYSISEVTNDQSNAGYAIFENVAIPKQAEYAYMDARITLANGITVYGKTINFSLTANGNITKGIVMMTRETCTVKGIAVDTYGNTLPGVNATLHVLGYDPAGDTSIELYNTTTQTSGQPDAGRFVFENVTIPKGPESSKILAYVEISVQKSDTTYLGRSNNYTMQADSTLDVGAIAIRLPP